ncbi:MAG: amidohydrolase [Steroidobacteraceae bacterium]
MSFVGTVALLCAWTVATHGEAQQADLVLRNGRIVTVDPQQPEAQALAVVGDRIVAVGSDAQIAAYVGKRTNVIDLQQRLALPGFIEAHSHLLALGEALTTLDLSSARTWDEVVAMVAKAARDSKPGEWILGRNWHHEFWNAPPRDAVNGFPRHETVSAVTPDNPVELTHTNGHATLVNAQALRLAGIGRETPDPQGGEIVRDAAGMPTGILRETAQGPVNAAIERYRKQRFGQDLLAETIRYVELGAAEALSKGVTSFQDAGSSFETIDLFKQLADQGRLPIRLYVMISWDEPNAVLAEKLPHYRMVGYGNNRLTVRAIKRGIDGALGTNGAWLLAPYDDKPESTGLARGSPADIAATAELAIRHGFQLCTHAIGDRANREVLNIYEQAMGAHPQSKDLRWRIEHASTVHESDVPRFTRAGIIASIQGVFATSDAAWMEERLGKARAAHEVYGWRRLWDAGVMLANGTDTPFEAISPIMNFYATATRRTADGSVFMPEQRLTREQALRTYTYNNAYAAFEEDQKGTLTPG